MTDLIIKILLGVTVFISTGMVLLTLASAVYNLGVQEGRIDVASNEIQCIKVHTRRAVRWECLARDNNERK